MGGILINRRQWLYTAGMVAGAGHLAVALKATNSAPQGDSAGSAKPAPLPLGEYEPKSMLRVHETRVERGHFPCIDIHTHITVAKKSENGVELSAERQYLGTPQELLAIMDRKNIRAMVNLTGGYDAGLAEAVAKYDRLNLHFRIIGIAENVR